ncbi:MAG: polyribonucleotide nucleotidyltransferase [Candidatus Aureabacteria bacterium]|nr:polyribonucleotide nucleotidyltransferase [Candidatus Auribacterota bacterium]
MEHSVVFELAGREIEISTGRMAKQADGSVTVRMADTVVLATAVAESEPREGVDFFPLTVDYREKSSAVGRFPGGYIKREGRPTEKEILTSRLTDRPIRPLFPDDYLCEVQVMTSVLSADEENDPDILSIIGASAALCISDIPFSGPVGAVRVGMIEGQFVVNPTYEQMKKSRMDVVLAATEKGLVMVEGSAQVVSEECLFDALMTGFQAAQLIIKAQHELREKAGREKRPFESVLQADDQLAGRIKELALPGLAEALKIKEKKGRSETIKDIFTAVLEKIKEEKEDTQASVVGCYFHELERKTARDIILNENVRCDGRGLAEIRPIVCEVGLLPRTHGSALFTRGETQALVMTTLGGAGDTQRLESYEGETEKFFMLHYNFPPFSVGEIRPVRGPGRREIGHGMLAERALYAVLPDNNSFPYTIRIVSDILESNGSSSMASVCGGCLSLMDAGVPIKATVAGIAMGLVIEGGKHAVLSDILGLEDHLGDMDFKVAGTREGITAIQMDLKIDSIDKNILKQALQQAKEGRLHILDVMERTLAKPRSNISKYAPKIMTTTVPKDKIGLVIGPGGSTIKKLIEKYKVEIDISDDGLVSVYSTVESDINGAIEEIKLMTAEIEKGKTYKATVKKIVDFGAFVEVLPGKEGLVHISRIANYRVNRVEDEMKVGDQFNVKCIDIDDKGRCVLSKKDADNELASGS